MAFVETNAALTAEAEKRRAEAEAAKRAELRRGANERFETRRRARRRFVPPPRRSNANAPSALDEERLAALAEKFAGAKSGVQTP